MGGAAFREMKSRCQHLKARSTRLPDRDAGNGQKGWNLVNKTPGPCIQAASVKGSCLDDSFVSFPHKREAGETQKH